MMVSLTAEGINASSPGKIRRPLRAMAHREGTPCPAGGSIPPGRPPDSLPEDLPVVGVLVSEMIVAGLHIDHPRVLVSLSPGDDFVALRLIGGQQRMTFI